MLCWIILENVILIWPPTHPIWSFKLVTLKSLTTKLFNSIGIVFSSNLFSSHTLARTCVLHLKLQLLFVSFISQSLLHRFQYKYLPYACFTSITIFRLIQSLKVTPESLLHSRVKHSITHSSVIIYSSNFKGGLSYLI